MRRLEGEGLLLLAVFGTGCVIGFLAGLLF
jgi:hypothetical protein